MLTRRPHLPRPRRGFSLIEVLVVISIIGVLAAISAGAMFRLRAAQVTSNTEGTLSKLHGLMMTRWSAVLDGSKKTVPADLVARCGDDKERAASVWAYATLKNEFPTTFTEATTAIDLGGGVILKPRGIFKSVSTNNGATYIATQTPSAEQQSAALLYVAITQGGNQGNAAGSDGSNQQVGSTDVIDTAPMSPKPTVSLPVYKDGWGTHIAFIRNATGGEIGAAPYMKANSIKVPNGAPPPATIDFTVKNPLDPMGRLLVRTGNPWAVTVPTNGYRATMLTGLGLADFTNENFLPTLVSFGANKKPGTLLGGDDGGDDNLLSYRLRREGDKGN